jgi:hypothetical protein
MGVDPLMSASLMYPNVRSENGERGKKGKKGRSNSICSFVRLMMGHDNFQKVKSARNMCSRKLEIVPPSSRLSR